MKLKTLFRTANITKEHINEDDRTVELSFSSEEPYERYFGYEILDHSEKSIDFSRLRSGAPFLLDHDTRKQIGVIEDARIEGKRGIAVVRLSKSVLGEEVFQDIKDGIRTSISVGYQVNKMVLEEENKDDSDIYRVSSWTPMEVSSVSIPADFSVGVGRADDDEHEVEIINKRKKDLKMDDETKDNGANDQIDIESVKNDVREAESKRIRSLSKIGAEFKQSDMANEYIDAGKSVEAFREAVMAKISTGDNAPLQEVKSHQDIGMTEKEMKQFSFVKAINAAGNPGDMKAQKDAAFEYECSEATQKANGRTAKGIMIPDEILQRDLLVGTDTAGGYTVDTNLLTGSFIDLLRNRMMVMRMGATTLNGLVGDIAIPKQTGGASTYWVAENGAITESQQTIGQVALRPKTVGALTEYSRKLLQQSSIGIENFVRADISRAIALELDRAGINGTGVDGQPIGILNTTGIGDVAGGTNGLAPAWGHIVDLETEVSQDNADVGSLGYLTNAKARGKLKQVEKASSTGQFIWQDTAIADGFGSMNGYRVGASNQVPSNLTKGSGTDLSAIIYGNWADLIYGLWGGLDILKDPYSNSSTGAVRIVAFQDVDINVRHAESFAAMQDAITA
jgi:HK97 family phage major capsid protein